MSITPDQLDSLRAMDAPFMAEYFGVWAIKEDVFRAAVDRVSAMDLAVHVRTQQAQIQSRIPGGAGASSGSLYRVSMCEGGIAVVDIRGTLMKQETSLDTSTSTVAMRRSIRALAQDDNVKGVMIRIESPGGSSAGTQELADDIATLAKVKPVHAYIEDLGASAAYWLASQANVIATNPQGWVGSIGTYATIYDYSGAAAKEGIKVHVIRAGEFKGAGTPGTEITDGHLAEWQRLVDQTNAFFLQAVADGRGMSDEQVKHLNDGRVHIGKEAAAKNLVDHVENYDKAFARLRSAARAGEAAGPRNQQDNPTPTADTVVEGGQNTTAQAVEQSTGSDAEHRKESDMSQTTTAPATSEPKPASMAELKSACPGAPSDFLVEQAEKNATVAQAKDSFLQFQAAQIRARDEEIKTLKAKAGKPKSEDVPPADDEEEEESPAEGKKAKAEDDKEDEKPAAKKHGVKPISSSAAESNAAGGADASSELDRRVTALMAKSPNLPRGKAVAKVLGEDEELRQNYLAEQKK